MRGVLCLPWDSFLVSNDRPKIEHMFESRQDGAVEKPRLWRKILHVRALITAIGCFPGRTVRQVWWRCQNCACPAALSFAGRSRAIADPHPEARAAW